MMNMTITEDDLRELSRMCQTIASQAYQYEFTKTNDLMDKAAIVFDLLADEMHSQNTKR